MKLIFLSLLFLANSAFALIEVDHVQGASNQSKIDGWHIYYGNQNICSNQLEACNITPSHRDGELRIVLNSDMSQLRIATMHGFSIPAQKDLNLNALVLRWPDICNYNGLDSNCDMQMTSKAVFMALFIDANNNYIKDPNEEALALTFNFINTGFLSQYSIWGDSSKDGIGGPVGFTPFPADGKVLIEDITAAQNFPTLTYGSRVKKVRVLVSDVGLEHAVPTEAVAVVDLEVSPDGTTLLSNEVPQLENGRAYVFRIAMLDEANNLVQFFPEQGIDATCDTHPFTGCPWAAIPAAVQGR